MKTRIAVLLCGCLLVACVAAGVQMLVNPACYLSQGPSGPVATFTFGIQANTTNVPPTITAATITNFGPEILWTAPDASTTNTKTPPFTFFTNAGQYTLTISQWPKVTAYSFNQATVRAFVTNVTISGVSNSQTALASISWAYNTNRFGWSNAELLPVSINTLNSSWRDSGVTNMPVVSNLVRNTSLDRTFNGCSGLTGSMSDFSTMVLNTSLGYTFQSCSGLTGPMSDFSTMVLNTSLIATFQSCSGLTGPMSDFSTMVLNTSLSATFSGCSGLTGSMSDFSTMVSNTTCSETFRMCSGLTGNVSNFATMVKCTTFHDCFRSCSNLTGSVGNWTPWRTNIVDFDCYNSKLTYTNRPGCFANNIKTNGFTMRWDNCSLVQDDVSQILIDLDNSGATNGTINVGGTTVGISNQAANAAGYVAVTNLRAKTWTVTVN